MSRRKEDPDKRRSYARRKRARYAEMWGSGRDPYAVATPKRCFECQMTKPRTEFYVAKHQYCGLSANCRTCSKARAARWKSRNRAKHIYGAAKARAAKSGIEFDIQLSDVVIPETCPVLGIPLTAGASGILSRDMSPSLDRINNTRGYVTGNVAVISFRANAIKRDASVGELRAVVAYIESHTTNPIPGTTSSTAPYQWSTTSEKEP